MEKLFFTHQMKLETISKVREEAKAERKAEREAAKKAQEAVRKGKDQYTANFPQMSFAEFEDDFANRNRKV